MNMPLLQFTTHGIYCEQADVFIDPWKPVKKALITHAHSDHARSGHQHYLAHKYSTPIMKYRLGDQIQCQSVEYGEEVRINGVRFSFHPAGHIIGSSQIRVEYKGDVWVASGDYKVQTDAVSEDFEPLRCNTFITECTFGLPVFQWEEDTQVFDQINNWWRSNQNEGLASIILVYALGKAQRVLQGLDTNIGPIFCHGAVGNTNQIIENIGISLNSWKSIPKETQKGQFKNAMILATPSSLNSPWMKRFSPYRVASASGWMQLRGNRRRRGVDTGFVLSDHADWKGLNQTIKDTGAENIIVTHGYKEIFKNWLVEQGYNVSIEDTNFESEILD
ncbi:MAG: ligase-associated DNA damage response exonuclease [Flavobacteriales bacterium]|nr:ligase-associated DNA damage response exonuclease [Flavobacteriales bacterium]